VNASDASARCMGRRAVRGAVASLVLLCLAGCHTTDTVAPGFDETKFKALPIGSSKEQVVASLGQPLDSWNHWNSSGVWDRVYWSYRKRASMGATHHAVIAFSTDGRLIDRTLEWYED